jgi:hypothetical protein
VDGASATTIGSTIYSIGGQDSTGKTSTDLYAMQSGSYWTRLPGPAGLSYAMGAVSFRNQLWVYDGFQSFYVFDPSTQTWATVGGPTVMWGHPVVVSNQLYVVGVDSTDSSTLFSRYIL